VKAEICTVASSRESTDTKQNSQKNKPLILILILILIYLFFHKTKKARVFFH
jgi:hypothetical protein